WTPLWILRSLTSRDKNPKRCPATALQKATALQTAPLAIIPSSLEKPAFLCTHLMSIKTLTIVGVGLIGGSIGLAAKGRGVAKRVLGVGRHPASLDRACAMRAIDEGLLDVGAAVSQADVAVFCTPVNCIADQILSAAPACAPGTLLTDAGSTKAEIVRAVEGRLPAGVHFVGSHPLAGSEKRGPEHADADLFHDRL